METMMVKLIRLKKQKQTSKQTPIPYQNLEEDIEELYLPIQSKSGGEIISTLKEYEYIK